MSPVYAWYVFTDRCFPRLRGDEPQRLNVAAWDITFSPPARG